MSIANGAVSLSERLPLPSVEGMVILSAMTIRANDWGVATCLASGAQKERVHSTTAATTQAAYLDYNASTPLDPRVAEVMVSALMNVGNATSAHGFGRQQAALVDCSREQVAALVGSRPSNVVFTASATEANNLAICGAVQAASQDQFRILVSAVEHASVFRTADWLRARGAVRVDVIPVTSGGFVDLGAVERLLGPDVLLVSVMAANGETGVVNPIMEVAELAHASGSLFHCDATQFVGRIPLSMDDVGIDLVSVSGHKLGGPMGVGALIGTRQALGQLTPVIHGGGHERGLRSGSLNVPGIIGFGEAATLAVEARAEESIRLAKLRDLLTARLIAAVPGVVQIGDVERRLPNTACLRFRGADAEAVTVNLEPVAVSAGSACSVGSIEPSHVLLAMGLSRSAAFECVRFSLGRSNVDTDIEFAVSRAVQAVGYVRTMTAEAV
ncbi:MAG: cysteine desulfurase family protein [Gemmatimonadota bacterium]|nr:cysteine desulfurase family protein [Gemmatimonadota bacterium]